MVFKDVCVIKFYLVPDYIVVFYRFRESDENVFQFCYVSEKNEDVFEKDKATVIIDGKSLES